MSEVIGDPRIEPIKDIEELLKENSDRESITKAFYSQKYGVWLQPLGPGQKPPEGARIFTGKRGGSYYVVNKEPKKEDEKISTTPKVENRPTPTNPSVPKIDVEEERKKLTLPETVLMFEELNMSVEKFKSLVDEATKNTTEPREQEGWEKLRQYLELSDSAKKNTNLDVVVIRGSNGEPQLKSFCLTKRDKKVLLVESSAFTDDNRELKVETGDYIAPFDLYQYTLTQRMLDENIDALIVEGSTPDFIRIRGYESTRLEYDGSPRKFWMRDLQRGMLSVDKALGRVPEPYDAKNENSGRLINTRVFLGGKERSGSPKVRHDAEKAKEVITELAKKLPFDHVQQVSRVSVSSEGLKAYHTQHGHAAGGLYHYETKIMTLPGNERGARHAFVHEVGHGVFHHIYESKLGWQVKNLYHHRLDQWNENKRIQRFVSDYARTEDSEEFFCECYSAYINEPDTLWMIDKEMYRLLDQNVFGRSVSK